MKKKESPAGENVVESKDLVKQDIVEQKVFAVKKIIGTKAMDVMEPLEAYRGMNVLHQVLSEWNSIFLEDFVKLQIIQKSKYSEISKFS